MSSRDLWEDRHLNERGAWAEVEHPALGTVQALALPWIVNGARLPIETAPTLGQHDGLVRNMLDRLESSGQSEDRMTQAGVSR